ncbi:MAG TPA: NlpC/P60 family protein [Candidatus Krumholzibacteria bacterium]|nr:NlpC/P60 family protein [Candidatus Krumholzibacteria bacterium]
MQDLAPFEASIRAALAAEGLDPRGHFWRLRPAAGGVQLEATEASFARRGQEALRQQFPGSRVEVVLLPAPELQAQRAWVKASVAEVRAEPKHEAAQTTQALQGEVLEPLLHEEGWLLARLPDGYLGWVRDWHLRWTDAAVPSAFAARTDARIASPLVRLRETPGPGAAPVAESPLGTAVVRRQERDDWVEIELPGGAVGWVRRQALRPGSGLWETAAPSLLDMLQGFLGVPYLWGGKSPKGFDCSGLVQFAFALHGVPLPRDSDQQFGCGVPVQQFTAGDLLFFGRERIGHVGVALDAHRFIHARGEVRRDSLAPDSPLHAPELAAILRGGRRLLPPPR